MTYGQVLWILFLSGIIVDAKFFIVWVLVFLFFVDFDYGD